MTDTTINDPHSNWGMNFLGVRKLRKKRQITGNNIRVAILDTGIEGIERHNPNLTPAIENKIDYCPHCTSHHVDVHGTHVAGIIGSRDIGKNNEGMAPNCKLLIAKVHSAKCCELTHESLINGIYWALDNDADIINISQQIGECHAEVQEAIHQAFIEDVIIVCGAGNSDNGLSVEYPAAYQKSIAVGGIKSDGTHYSGSDTGKLVDFAAPAHNIKSSMVSAQGEILEAGTSYAAAFMTGTLTLFLEEWLKHNSERPKLGNLKALMMRSSVKPYGMSQRTHDPKFGWGTVMPEALIRNLHDPLTLDKNTHLSNEGKKYIEAYITKYPDYLENPFDQLLKKDIGLKQEKLLIDRIEQF